MSLSHIFQDDLVNHPDLLRIYFPNHNVQSLPVATNLYAPAAVLVRDYLRLCLGAVSFAEVPCHTKDPETQQLRQSEHTLGQICSNVFGHSGCSASKCHCVVQGDCSVSPEAALITCFNNDPRHLAEKARQAVGPDGRACLDKLQELGELGTESSFLRRRNRLPY